MKTRKLRKDKINNRYQDIYLKSYIKEMGNNSKAVIKTDHHKGLSYINGKPWRVIFPPSLINFILDIPKTKVKEYCFIGNLTKDREWVKDFASSDSIIRSTNQTKYNRARYDRRYYKDICKSKFTLCPVGNCPWSYRFFEAIMCFSIPIMEKNSTDRFYKDYFYYTVGEDHVYSFKDALNNFRIFLNTNGPH